MNLRSVRLVVLSTVLGLVAASCSNEPSTRNVGLTIPKQTLPKLTITSTTVATDPVSDLDYRNWGRGEGMPDGGSFGTVDISECVGAIRESSKESPDEITHIWYLVTMYADANDGYVDCSDPQQTWEEIQDWINKLVHRPLPSLKVSVQGFSPTIEAPRVVWRESVRVNFPFPEAGTIFATDIDPATGRGTPWILDRIDYRTKSGRTGNTSLWSSATSPAFTYLDFVAESAYQDNDPQAWFAVEARAIGVDHRGRTSPSRVQVPRDQFILANLVRDDKFVVVGFGDSYGSGEGNPGSGTRWHERAFFQSDENTMANPESLFWPEGELSEFSVNTQWHDHCHRSSQSGLAKAVKLLGDRYTGQIKYGHFACSGAVTENIWLSSYVVDFWGFERAQDPQVVQALEWLASNRLSPAHVDAIVVSAGGNDSGFGEVIKSCFILGGDCNDETDILGYYNKIFNVLNNRMGNLVNIVGQIFPNAKIFYTAYTDGISVSKSNPGDKDRWEPWAYSKDGVCSDNDDPPYEWVEYDTDEFWDILTSDSKFVVRYMNRINETLATEIAEISQNGARPDPPIQDWKADWVRYYYPDVRSTDTGWGRGRVFLVNEQFTNNRNSGFCAGSGNRNIRFNDEAGLLQGFDNFQSWSSGGWHPNDRGYTQYGEAIASSMARVFPETTRNLQARR
jgi:hypothetical protein